jgi:predicted RNA-binding protein (virulence factor B family)
MLSVRRFAPHGAYLSDGVDEVLLPQKYVPGALKAGDSLSVFVYRDSEERLVATTQKPLATAGQFACLTVREVTDFGAFLDWGLEKDLFMPFSQMLDRVVENRRYVVRVFVDEVSGRLVATSKLRPFFDKDITALSANQKVSALVYGNQPFGALVVIDNRYSGLIHSSEFKQPPKIGTLLTAYIRRVQPENKIDVSLAPAGAEGRADAQEEILQKLKAAGGFLPLHDKTPPDEIDRVLNLSKKTFKKLVGNLLKKKLIVLEPGGIRLVSAAPTKQAAARISSQLYHIKA